VCSCLLSVGSHFASHMLNALKPELKDELGITNLEFGLLTSASALINTIVPVFGGVFVDVFGTGWGAIAASTLVMVGEILTAAATNVSSYPMMLVGRIVYGLGAGCIVTVQEAILAHWFKGRSLALVIGFQLAISRLSSFLAVSTVTPIINATGFYGTAFWVSAATCAFSWLVMVVYIIMLRLVVQRGAGDAEEDEKMKRKLVEKNTFSWRSLGRFNDTVWLLVLLSFLFGFTWAPFMRISTEMIMFRFGSEDTVAAWYSSLALVVPIVLNPILGGVIAKWGKRTWIVNASAALQFFAFLMAGFSCVNPTVAQVIFSFSLAMGPVAMITAFPLVLPVSLIGTALGLYKCASNIGTTIMEPLQGHIQDIYGSYDPVMVLLASFAASVVLASILLTVVSIVKHKGLLDATDSEQTDIIAANKGGDALLTQDINKRTVVYIALLVASLVISWALYLYFIVLSSVDADQQLASTPSPTPTVSSVPVPIVYECQL